MRFIKLQEDNKSPYDNVMKLGCGPNFVLNRQREFRLMIKSQGFRFWFRFWLIFCNHSKGNNMKKFDEEWPEAKAWACVKIHEEFLQGTQEKATDYCINKAVNSLIFQQVEEEAIDQYIKMRGRTQKEKFERLFQECSHMTFGAALCVLFHNWLEARDLDTKYDQYWTMPKKYLDHGFTPGTLEKYLVGYWEMQLLPLFGFNKNRMPNWIHNLLSVRGISSIGPPQLKSISILYDDSVTSIMEIRKQYWRTRIKGVDEELKEDRRERVSRGVEKCASETYKRRISEWKCEQWSELTVGKFGNKTKACAFCGNSGRHNFTLCELCLTEKWTNPRWYCSTTCQLEDWLRYHSKEHALLRGGNLPRSSRSNH